jgi:hypothetical protein
VLQHGLELHQIHLDLLDLMAHTVLMQEVVVVVRTQVLIQEVHLAVVE